MERLSTGNRELDLVLDGGIPQNSINVVTGLPGSGKTILAQQFAFANARPERPVLYLTTLSEPLPKLIKYLQELSFADVEAVGVSVVYESLAETLVSDPQQLTALVTEFIQRYHPGVIIIDSFKAIADLMTPAVWRRSVFDLAGLLAAYDTTSLWVGEYGPRAIGEGFVEFAVADGIIEMNREQTGSRDDRFLRVAKLRGSGFRDGSHAFTIDERGLKVFPRLVGPERAATYEPVPQRLQTGIGGLDDMIEHGWLRGTSTLLAGPSGAGKTTVGLQFLKEGVTRGEPGLLVNFQESPTQLRRAMRSFGWDVDALLQPGKLDVLYTSPVELHIDTIVQEVLQRVEQQKIQRVSIDALADIERSARDPQRFMDYLYALNQMFSVRNVTTMLVLEVVGSADFWHGEVGKQVSYMSDNVVLLSMDLGDDLTRTVRIIKSRGSPHDGRRRKLDITRDGVQVQLMSR